MSNFALGRFVRMLILFVFGFFLAYHGLIQARVIMTEQQHGVISLIAGFVFSAVGKRHT
jgi:hypothetical protein